MKKLALAFAGLVVLLLIAGQFLWSNLDSYIKSAIVTYGSAATQATVHVSHVKISLTTGEGSLKGLSVGSPKGFTADRAVDIGLVSIKIDTQSVTGAGPIVINDIAVEKPKVTYEVTGDANNLDTLARNARDYVASPQAQQDSAEKQNAGHHAGDNSAKEPQTERKLIVDDLTIRDGDVAIIHPLLHGRKVSTRLPDIHLKDIGRNQGGVTPAQLIQIVINAITKGATQEATKSLTRGLGNITTSGGKIGDKIKGLFGR